MLLRDVCLGTSQRDLYDEEEMCHFSLRNSHSITNERILTAWPRFSPTITKCNTLHSICGIDVWMDESGINNAMTKLYKCRKTCLPNAIKSICLYVYAFITFGVAIFSEMRRHLCPRTRYFQILCAGLPIRMKSRWSKLDCQVSRQWCLDLTHWLHSLKRDFSPRYAHSMSAKIKINWGFPI